MIGPGSEPSKDEGTDGRPRGLEWTLRPPGTGEELALAELRARAMEPSLRAAGRWDEQRVRRRFLDGYDPARTSVVESTGQTAGFFVLEDRTSAPSADWYLVHFYLDPPFHGRGLGSQVLEWIFQRTSGRPLRLGALRGSPAQGFYQRHGFVAEGQDETDTFYLRLSPRP